LKTPFVYLIIFVISQNLAIAWDKSDFKKEVTSPWSHHVNNVFWTGTALTVLAVALEDGIDPIEDEVAEDKPLGSFSRFGDLAGKLYPNAGYVVGQLIAGVSGNKHGYRRALEMAKGTGYASAVTWSLKNIVREPRPRTPSQKDSFPSAHSTHAFAFGGYVLSQHGLGWGIPALAISSFSAASRINDNRHRLHDVIAGATIGLSYGLGLGWLNRKHEISEEEKEDEQTATFFIAPIYESDIKGVVMLSEF